MSKGQKGSSRAAARMPDKAPLPPPLDRLRGRMVPFRVWFFEAVPSTNSTAADLLAGGLQPPALVVTAHQTAGRGQPGKTWFSSPASLAVSFVVPAGVHRPVQRLPLVVGLGVREVVAGIAPDLTQRVQVKWPNDVLIGGRKVAGVLCERKSGADIIGIGINIRHEPGEVPPELRGSIIALSDIGATVNRWDLLAALAEALRARLLEATSAESWEWALSQWPAHDALLGRAIEVSTPQGPLRGVANGIDSEGRLRVTLPGGDTAFVTSGSVRIA